MDHQLTVKQMIEMNKAAFETTFNTVALLQDQLQMMGNLAIEQAQWIPTEGKKVSDEWMNACRKGRDNFKKAMDEGFAKAEAFLVRA